MSDLRVNSIAGADGTSPATLVKQSAAKAWANLNGTGAIALRDSFNISSVVDNGIGNYGFNYNSAMANTNFADSNSTDLGASGLFFANGTRSVKSASAVRFNSLNASAGNQSFADTTEAIHLVHGDLA